MLTSNIDIEDCLINGQMGSVYDVECTRNRNIKIILVKFDDRAAGLTKMHKLVPISRIEIF